MFVGQNRWENPHRIASAIQIRGGPAMKVRTTIFCMVLLVAASQGAAQVTTATFYGSVTDASEAVLPGVSITMTHEGTGIATSKVSDERGEFAFTFLQSGTYSLKLELPGFKTYLSSGFELGAAQNVRRKFVLEV